MDTYSSGLFSCFNDMNVCFFGVFCPCCLNASNLAHVRRENCTPLHCVKSVSPFWTRQLVREAHGFPKDYTGDCLKIFFCYSCTICQDSRELFNEKVSPKPLV